jgi:S-phase kinase-associated protein 1
MMYCWMNWKYIVRITHIHSQGDQIGIPVSTIVLPLPKVDSRTLPKVLEYLRFHHHNKATDIEKPLRGRFEDLISAWDNDYLAIEKDLLVNLSIAAWELKITDLLNLVCARIATMLKGKTPEQIRGMFGITNDFTPQEEERIREENSWCEESD